MKRIGLVGEDPNDTSSIKNLLSKEGKFQHLNFFSLAKQVRGHQLDNPKTKRIIDFDIQERKPELVIFIRDLDTDESSTEHFDKKIKWFQWLNSQKMGILLLNVYELEALILADIDTFNKIYKTKITFNRDPMRQRDPKGFLKEKTRKNPKTYSEGHAPTIFAQLNLKMLSKNCRYFKAFIDEFESKVSEKK